MNKKTLIIIVISAVVIILGLSLFLFLRPSEDQRAEQEKAGSLFPSGEEKVFPEGAESVGEPTTIEYESMEEMTVLLAHLTDTPVSGAAFNPLTKKVRYIEKATGHLYEINSDGTEEKQLTITTIPGIYSIDWSTDRSKAILKYFDTETEDTRIFLSSFSASSSPQTEVMGQTEGVFLPSSTLDTAASPNDNNKIFYLTNGETARGIVSSFENENKKEIFSSSFSDFIVQWPRASTITLLTKPAAAVKGSLYKINPNSGAFTKILGNINGLTALHSEISNKLVYSESANKSFGTKIYDTDNGNTAILGVSTLSEKCFFSKKNEAKLYCAVPTTIPAADYPDEWYRGEISFSDIIWEINIETGSTKIIFSHGNFDATNLFTDENESYLFFVNKKDSTLWSLRIQ